MRSDDFFASKHENVFSCGNIVEKVGDLLYMIAPASCVLKNRKGKKQEETAAKEDYSVDNSHAHIFVSEDFGQSFTEVCMPVSLEIQNFGILEGDDGGAMIIALHNSKKNLDIGAFHMFRTANAYTSGNVVNLMSLSLKDIFCDSDQCEIDKIKGVPGTYIANQLVVHPSEADAISVETVMSYNGGATWDKIPAPTVYNDVSCKTCVPGTEDCNLHLHVSTYWQSGTSAIPPLYSHENAPGIIMGVGTVGPSFDPHGKMCTYLSRDGGRTFEQVLEDVLIYEFGDHGGLILAARHAGLLTNGGLTDELYFSVDEGRCWQGPIYMEEAMNVDNIRVETDSASHVFTVVGTTCIDDGNDPGTKKCKGQPNSRPKGVVATIDFRQILKDFNLCTDSDYEPFHLNSDMCQLGREWTYTRRKREVSPEGLGVWHPFVHAHCKGWPSLSPGIETRACVRACMLAVLGSAWRVLGACSSVLLALPLPSRSRILLFFFLFHPR